MMNAAKETIARSARSKIAKALAGPGPHLGDVVFMSMSGVLVRRTDIRAAFAAHNVPENLAPEDATPEAAFGMAIAMTKPEDAHVFLRRQERAVKGADVLIVRQFADATGIDRFETCARVGLGSSTGGSLAVVQGPGWNLAAEAVVDQLKAHYAERLDFARSTELSGAIVDAVLGWCGGIRLRDRGNLYWTLAGAGPDIRNIAAAIASLKAGDSYVSILPVHDSAEARAAVGRAASESFETDLAAALAEIEKFKGAEVRPETLQRRLADYEDVAARVDLYADVLEQKRDSLLARLEQAKAAVRELLVNATA